MGLVRCTLSRERSVAYILHTERRSDDEHFVQSASAFGLQDHAPNTWVQGQFGQLSPQWGELMLVVHSTQFIKELVAIGDCFGPRGL